MDVDGRPEEAKIEPRPLESGRTAAWSLERASVDNPADAVDWLPEGHGKGLSGNGPFGGTEIARNVYRVETEAGNDMRAEWRAVARTGDPEAAFVAAYKAYLHEGRQMAESRPVDFEFMRQVVFGGKEFRGNAELADKAGQVWYEPAHGGFVRVLGDPDGATLFNHEQGENRRGFCQTCAVAAVAEVQRQRGHVVNETDMVERALDENMGLATESGGMRAGEIVDLLGDAHGLCGADIGRLENEVKAGRGVIVGVDAGRLWNDASYEGSGHAIAVTGVAYDGTSRELVGFYINDTNRDPTTGKLISACFVSADHMVDCWESRGGVLIATNHPLTRLGGM